MIHVRALAVTTLTGLVLLSTGPATAAADPCTQAKRLVGEDAGRMDPAECQRVLDAAEEERWQLWLDMALAHEHSKDFNSALTYYNRFLDAVARRTRPLNGAWVQVHEDAVKATKRLDATMLETMGKVEVTSTPADALASFEGKAASNPSHTTPFTAYLPPGEHTLDLAHPGTGAEAQHKISVVVGEATTLAVDLTSGGHAAEAPPKKEPADASTATAPDATVSASTGPNTEEVLGHLAIGAGIAAGAVGAVLYFTGQGLIDEAACGDEPWCDVTVQQRARRKADGEDFQSMATVVWVAGGLAIIGGAVALITADDDPAEAPEAASGLELRSVGPTLLPGGAGAAASLSF